MIAERSLGGLVAGLDVAFQNVLGARRHRQIIGQGLGELGARAAQQAGESELGERIRQRGHGGKNGGGVRPQRHRNGKALPWMDLTPLSEVQCATAM